MADSQIIEQISPASSPEPAPAARKVLILTEHFAPAYRAGGIVRSLENLVHNFNGPFSFAVITGNSDLGTKAPLPAVQSDQWLWFKDEARVIYLSPANQQTGKRGRLMAEFGPEVVYINGIFSLPFVVFALLAARRLRPRPVVIVAPRGMLQQGALSVKPLKKKAYFTIFKAFGLHQHIRWHATDPQEVTDIRRMFGKEAAVVLANDTPDLTTQLPGPIVKQPGNLKLVTISLITAKKGHLTMLETLKALENDLSVEYHIYGPVKDPEYWRACQQVIATLKPSIKVTWHGNIHPTEVTATLQQHHFFVLPSKGENFGHAIYESLNAGRPVIISDQTPWKRLQAQGAGWDLDLREPQSLPEAILRASRMGQAEYDQYCAGAQGVVRRFVAESDFAGQYKVLFS